MKFRVLSWNVREANDRKKCNVIKSLFRLQMTDLICLQETKVQHMSMQLIRSLGMGRFLEWRGQILRVGSYGNQGNNRRCSSFLTYQGKKKRGGMIVLWDNRILELIKIEMGAHSISC